MIGEAQAVGDRAEAVLEPLGGVAGAVERAAELQHEADGGGIGLVAAALEALIARVGHGGSGTGR